MKIVFMSDTHAYHKRLQDIPNGDILIHSGDFTIKGTRKEAESFNEWVGKLPHKHKIVIAGNGDSIMEQPDSEKILTNVIYLQEKMIEIEGLKIYGTPITPRHSNTAFNRTRGDEIQKSWDTLPSEIDILITHCPPYTKLDNGFGCQNLIHHVLDIKPMIHCFGHIHEGHGVLKEKFTTFVNSAILNEEYRFVNKPIVLEI